MIWGKPCVPFTYMVNDVSGQSETIPDSTQRLAVVNIFYYYMRGVPEAICQNFYLLRQYYSVERY